jgi:hypothetical protein
MSAGKLAGILQQLADVVVGLDATAASMLLCSLVA